MEIIGKLERSRITRLVGRAWKLGLVAAGAGIALAAGTPQVPTPTPSPTTSATATPQPTPEPTPTPVPEEPGAIASAHVAEAQERLNALGYPAGPVDGKAGGVTHHAVLAFQKMNGLERTGSLTPEVLQAIRTASRPTPRFGNGRHVEIDLDRQVLLYVDGGVQKVLNASSGTGKPFTSQGWTRRAVTPTGRFTVTRKISGWRISPLGKLYYPSYIVGGIAVHGAPSVPAYPASHGCIRIPMFAAQEMYDLMPRGTSVIVHASGSVPQETDTASPPGQDSPDASEPAEPDPTPTPTPEATPEATPEPTPSPDRTPRPPTTPQPVLPEQTPTPTPAPTASPSPSAGT